MREGATNMAQKKKPKLDITIPAAIGKDIQDILDYMWEDEAKNYEEADQPAGHVFEAMNRVQEALELNR